MDFRMVADLTLTRKQEEAVRRAKEWWNGDKRRPFVITGNAGCLDPNTLILTDQGYITLGNIIKSEDDDMSFEGFKDYHGKYKVVNMNGDLTEISQLYSTPVMNGYYIRLADGSELRMSEIHPVLVKNGNDFSWKRAYDLEIDDELLIWNHSMSPSIDIDTEDIDTKFFFFGRFLGDDISLGGGYDKETMIDYYLFVGDGFINPNKFESSKQIYSFLKGLLRGAEVNLRNVVLYNNEEYNLRIIQRLLSGFNIESEYMDNSLIISTDYFDMLDKFFPDVLTGEARSNATNNIRNENSFSKIVEITDIEGKFYDITVPDTASFISNGMVSHNTGKTTVVNFILEALDINRDRISMIAFTGAAAVNLTRKGSFEATTIHQMIYNVFEDPKTKEKKFYRKEKEEVRSAYDLIIVDELGTISDKIMEDLMYYEIPIIALGDPNQLPPVQSHENRFIYDPDVHFTEVMRQALDNPIIRLATDILNDKWVDFTKPNEYLSNNGGVSLFSNPNNIPIEVYTGADQIIAGRNKTVQTINNNFRRFVLGIDIDKEIMPMVGEKIILLRNYWGEYRDMGAYKQYPVNGLVGTLGGYPEPEEIFALSPDSLINTEDLSEYLHDKSLALSNIKFDIAGDKDKYFVLKTDRLNYFKGTNFNSDKFLYDSELKEENKIAKGRSILRNSLPNIHLNYTNFAYAMTVYKSQGTDFGNVTYYDDVYPRMGKKLIKQQRYTAVTRAKNNLAIVKF